ncbi:PAS domain S-box-containing protein [Bradyrhizobium japonicum USDA 38]|uniref:PAS domain-containing sensor histidine kinase n=1 Tax=Bradyrhizobium japonicum TaxID=375 RepID=UPI000412CBEC|nr:PAS domain-containing protein [Bradyrhizobium japonicum]MCS3892886.1 PAS domain S-box-containing protein [Bradyrhizobium japonicum USDA 38]MCS3945399.1 PAS domain S-box-containing protein [Bradyrhizobium japonicum]MCW2222074.1 PAS domain S-box-containing protein [Bradyrhizobium japonicum]MCW2346686.1 PAS domain S-box-containing protein [Bradyrhizobium japonicum]
MTSSDFQLRGVGDPRLAVHATSPLPAWLWSIDGTRVLWANPVGARLFGAAHATALADRTFGPADSHRRQVARLARRLAPNGAIRLERLQGFGARLGMLMTCACARLDFADGSSGVLVTAMDPTQRAMPLVERLHRLVEGARVPMAAFAPDGLFVGASEAARSLLGFRDLGDAGLDQARSDALAKGRAETPIGIGQMVLQRVGVGADVGLVALIEPAARQAAPDVEETIARGQAAPPAPEAPPVPPAAAPDYAQPARPSEAASGIALFDAFAEPVETPAPTEALPPSEMIADAHAASDAMVVTIPEAAEAPVQETIGDAAPKTPVENPREAIVSPQAAPITSHMVEPQSAEPSAPRQHPLRFLWQVDKEGRFVLGSDEFIHLIGAHTAAGFGRPWREIADEFALDPDGRVAQALASHDTWAGITVNWPADGGEHLPVELAGLPIYDRERNFAGFRGFGVCRDLDGLNRLDALRRFELFAVPRAQHGLSADVVDPEPEPVAEAPPPPSEPPVPEPEPEPTPEPELPEPVADANSHPTDPETPVETPPNVVPFRPPGDVRSPSDQRSPTLSPVENSAFNELARQLSERLERERETIAAGTSEPPAAERAPEPPMPEPEAPHAPAEWLTEPAPPAQGHSVRDRALLDLLPTGILIYRLDRLLYANPAFLARMGHSSLGALEDAGGLDALYVEPGVSSASSTSQAGTPVTISATLANGHEPLPTTEAHLHTIDWDGASAHALICALPQAATVVVAPPVVVDPVVAESFPYAPEPEAGDADAEDLAAILDTTAEGIVMFDAEGNIHACNRSAEALFGYDGEALMQRNLVTLFAPESQQIVADYLESLKSQDIASLLDHGREVLGREKKGGVIPLAMIMGRTRPDGPNFFAVFRDLSQSKKGESELKNARRLADGAANAKADMLARISHEIRTPLNAIIGFAEVMISERFGTLGNERYGEYMKDIRASGERVITIIDDLLELSRIETGKLDLSFANLNLNDLVEACVTVMQPQANRERIIIRTSLGHALPQVSVDARAMRQITMNLISNSIRLASAGGQVIVSTALTDRGEIALRIRDTGHGLSEREVAAAMEPFRTPPPGDAADSSALSLSLTKALVEANRARFNIKSAGNSGTLIEVVFAPVVVKA